MIKILNCKNKNYKKKLIEFLEIRRSRKYIDTSIVSKILNDVKKNKLKAVIKYAARAANQEMLDEYTARNNKALNELIEKHDIELKKLPDNVLVELRRITDEVMEDFIADDEMARRVYKSYKEFKDQVINYHRISEKAYIDTRELD